MQSANPFSRTAPGTYSMVVQNPIGTEVVQPISYQIDERIWQMLGVLEQALDQCSENSATQAQSDACSEARPLIEEARTELENAVEEAGNGRTVYANARATFAVAKLGEAMEILRGMFGPAQLTPEDIWAYMLQTNAAVLNSLNEERDIWASYDPYAANLIARIFHAPGKMLGLSPQMTAVAGIAAVGLIGWGAYRLFTSGKGRSRRGRRR